MVTVLVMKIEGDAAGNDDGDANDDGDDAANVDTCL